ncbi:putative transport protein YidE [Austwickia sp. TVS 96-490-7B]|uniref:aspartate:alanine exchanger family transporter n=1 Tax=Austwickia sp. TVS 96-490-7B TaxID=2830843 RepID=UPI001E0E389A|nr:TrkA C-terminal domain-containing protein [Austwickia sp. TVS 96-490-7B]MBW3086700.1 putative transport protein YidE [Austwickia sp. TVS 96-490-7B]
MDLLAAQPVLTVMCVVALGALLGQVPLGPLRLGPAGALFVGLCLGALDPRVAAGLGSLKTLGVLLFCYTVGLTAGGTFRSDLRRQWTLMVAAVVGLGAVAVAASTVGWWCGLSSAHVAGLFAGVLTSPAIDAAISATQGSPDTLVGYALSYPVGVFIGLVVVAVVIDRPWPGRRDTKSLAQAGLTAVTTRVERTLHVSDIPGWTDQIVKLSYLERDEAMRVISADDELRPDDRVLVVGNPEDVDRAVEAIGRPSTSGALTHHRRDVDFRRFLVTNPDLVGRTLGELNVEGRLRGIVTRVRRRDLDMLARDDVVLQPGDRVLAVVPTSSMEDASDFFGDSDRRASQLDALSLGLGIAVGMIVGALSVPLPSGQALSLGAACGTLVVAMVLGAVHRTGPLRWDLPHAVNATVRQVGLMIFLSTVGLASGPAMASQAFSRTGVVVVAVSGVSLLVGAVVMVTMARVIGLSAPRSAGGWSGFVGQPAILAFAASRRNDERIESAYGALFALGTIVKIVVVPFLAR